MTEHVDVAVIGMGPGGEVAASRLIAAGKKVGAIEQELIGGECAYWGCIPSKTLLRPAEARTEVDRAAGVSGADLNWAEASNYRDFMIRNLDDSEQVEGYSKQGVLVIKGAARITGPGRIEADGRELTAEHILIATGTEAVIPHLDGIENITAWTNRETYTATTLPQRVAIIGGSAVAVETATFLTGFGAHVTLLHRGQRLLEREEPRASELVTQYLQEAGVDIRFGVTALRGHRDGISSVLDLDDGSAITIDVVIFATGRTARTENLGLDTIGVSLDDRGYVKVDNQCKAAENVWAIGDVTGVMPFTHVAKYQGRIAADSILGKPHPATYEGIPRVVFGDPEIAAAGLTQKQADVHGLTTVSTELDLAKAIARPWTYEQNPRGHLGLLADTETKTLIGAWAVGPMAAEWIHHASLAIRTKIPIETLRDQVAQFPTYNEAYQAALEQLKI
jgi:pyruvate/2-oxoglutarate dehydrogenase complex dihydrolipoamide dehydrogenase (E3) component